MLGALVEGALRVRGAVVALAALLLIYGGYAVDHARLEVLPDFAPPQVVVQTEAPGLTTEHVELLVTRPLEAALNGVVGLESLRSQSIQGLSVITAVFKDDVDPHLSRQMLAERLGQVARELPDGVRAPRLTPLTSATMDLLKIGLVCDSMTPAELRTFAQWTVRPRLLSVRGVAGVSLFGGAIEQLQVQVDPARLPLFDLGVEDILAATRASTGVRGAGFVESENQRVVLETRGQFDTPEELAQVVVAQRAGRPILLGDVATVTIGAEPSYGDALVMGRPGVLLTMLSQYGTNTMDVTRAAEVALADLAPLFAARGIEVYPRLHRPATFIETSLANMRESLLIGAALVAVVLFLFLLDLRTALISLAAIPLSLATAVIVLNASGAALNTITLGGLVIALGEVVDDAIIDIENIVRRLRENATRSQPRSAFAVVLAASLEVRSAVVHATFVVALVFVPVLMLSGLQGRLFAPMAEAYLLAILASLLVALTVTPALALILLPKAAPHSREPWLLARTKVWHSRAVEVLARRPSRSFALLAVAGACAFAALGGLKLEFLPEFREGHVVLQVSAVPGTSLVEMRRIGGLVSDALLANPHIATVEQQIGRAELGEDPWGTNRSEFHVELFPLDPAVEAGVNDEIRAVLAGFPGLRTEVLTFLGDRISETISGETAAVVFSVFGESLDDLESTAAGIAHVLANVPGAINAVSSAAPAAPSVEVALRVADLARFGLQPLQVLEVVEVAFQGIVAARVFSDDRVRDVVVIAAPDARAEPEAVGALRLRTPAGASVTLRDVADVRASQGRALVLHEDGRRRATATCSVSGRDIGGFVEEARRAVDRDVVLPTDAYITVTGTAEAEASARYELLWHSALAAIGIAVLIWLAFRSLRNAALVALNLPFALIGGICAARLGDGVLSFGSLVGLVTLFGITTRNAIVLVSHYEHLVRHEDCEWNLVTAVRGARERFTPILMTALVTGLAMAPLAIDSGAAGREIEGPMAAVILGGLTTSTLLVLFVLPGLALRFARFEPREIAD